jgi:hypothetical protein
MSGHEELPRMDRRAALKWMLTAAAGLMAARVTGWGATPSAPASVSPTFGHGYGTDPDLLKSYQPGELWPLTLTDEQRRTAAALCDVILPADSRSPSASALGVHDFIDEWISAPYPENQADRPVILAGLAWLNEEAQRRYGLNFAAGITRQKTAICDDICHAPEAKPEFKTAAEFFDRFRNLTGGGFYTTPEGMKDIGYIGNVPLASFDGPPQALIEKLGLT